MRDDVRQLLEVSTSVSDGNTVDWPHEESRATSGEIRGVLRQLRVVSSIATFHREQDPSQSGPSTVLSGAASQRSERGPAVPTTWGNLRILRLLGEGSYGSVLLAWDERLKREVALKLLHRSVSGVVHHSASILQEGRHLARVRHPNVVTIFGAEERDGRVGLEMEFVDGRTLYEVVKEQGPMAAGEACLVGIDVCRALRAVHGAGLVHRDVKAKNVMRESGGRIVLMDLGAGSDFAPDREHSVDLIRIGTPAYMAPEVLRGERETRRSDIYSLGVLLYYLVTGSHPLGSPELETARAGHVIPRSKPLSDLRPDLPQAFVAVVERALAPDPADRFAAAGEVEAALASVIGAPQTKPRESRVRAIRWWSAALLAVAAIACVGAWLWLDGRSTGVARTAGIGAEALLFRHRQGGIRDEALASGGVIAPQDEIYLQVRAEAPFWLYVLNRDTEGRTFALYPPDGGAQQRPMDGGVLHRIPPVRAGSPEGSTASWVVDDVGTRETFVVVLSTDAREDLERSMMRLRQAEPEQGSADKSRGAPSIAESEDRDAQRSLAAALARAAEDSKRGSNVTLIELQVDKPSGR